NIPADRTFVAFKAAKALGVDPAKFAAELAAAIAPPPDSLIGEVTATGAFLNFSLHPQRLAAAVLNEIETAGDAYGTVADGAGRTVVIDYSSPNIAKRMHVGHIRSTIIGQALVHIFRALGYRVIGDNHLGDWGTQFGIILAAMQRYGRPQSEGEAAMAELEALYARYNAEMKDDPALEDEARRWSLALERGDPEARSLWQW
ncbi:MAG: arginine--tRNA ligase, partial [Candidatus Thermofonsia Clade 3 bacterium]